MQGQRSGQRVLFDTVDIDSLVPEGHLLRKIDAELDFDFIYEVTKELYCVDNGRNSIDPVLLFKMQLISYLYGMKSDRELCREVHLNCQRRSKISPVGRRKTSPFYVMPKALLRVVPVVHRRDPRGFA